MNAADIDAVILAAGTGMRLRPHTLTRPKAMLEVAGAPIVGWQLGALDRLGVRRCVVVVGHQAATVESYLRALTEAAATPMALATSTNEAYASTGTAASLRHALGAGSWGAEALLVLEGDVLVTTSLLAELVDGGRMGGAGAVILAAPTPTDSSAVFVRPDCGVERVVHARNRGEQPTDPAGARWSNMSCYHLTDVRDAAEQACKDATTADIGAPVESVLDRLATSGTRVMACPGDNDRAREIDTADELVEAGAWWAERARDEGEIPLVPNPGTWG